jgi:capsular exopolysaccharide synthesis family protein
VSGVISGDHDFAPLDDSKRRMTPIEPQNRQPGLSDYIAILDRRKWIIIQSTLIVAVVAFILSAQQDKVFAASADVLLTRQSLSTAITGVTNPDVYVDPERFAATQAGLARAPEVGERAIDDGGIRNRSAGDLLASSSVDPRANADLLRFTVEDGEPAMAVRLANAYAKAFTDYKASLDTAQLVEARTDLEGRIAELRQDGQSGTELYRSLVDSAQQLRTMEILQTPNRVVRPATGAAQIAPTPNRTAILGAFVGLLLGLGIAFLWETLDKRVRTEEEIERRLGLPLLSRLPEPGRGAEKEMRLTMIHDPQDAYAEAVRRLRTNLEFANVDRDARVIMVTSAVEREGKSTTIANLAVALARSGRNVALVDLDLRQPVLAKYFDLQGQPGITDVVLERADLQATIAPIRLPIPVSASLSSNGSVGAAGRLNVLPTGPLPANPGELVGTQALGRVLDELRNEHDYVLIDAAPLLSVGDSMTLSARVDAILVVTRLGIVNRPMLTDLSRELETSPASKLGFVVTGIDLKAGYGYGHAYGQPTEAPSATSGPAGQPATDATTQRAARRATRKTPAGR